MDEDADAVAYVGELIDSGHRVGLLSNIPTFLAERVRARHTWLERFDAVTMSCDIGVAKPDPGAYRAACAALGAEPGEVLFFDDNPVNVAAAREFGMRAVEVTGRLVEWNH
nr:HAD-IA family hydrolase [Corynebacterium sp. TAE3-ERU16]